MGVVAVDFVDEEGKRVAIAVRFDRETCDTSMFQPFAINQRSPYQERRKLEQTASRREAEAMGTTQLSENPQPSLKQRMKGEEKGRAQSELKQ